jgi:plasmid stabilization system protein ParE
MIIFTETFHEDLRNIWDFIALDNEKKATEVTGEIIDYCLNNLTVVPHMWQRLSDSPEIRKLTWPYEYSIVFENTGEETHVLMVYKRAQRKW